MEKTIKVRVSDFDGVTPAKPHSFGVDDEIYDIDLDDPVHAELHAALARFKKVARRRPTPAPKLSTEQYEAIRHWVRKNRPEIPISDRGFPSRAAMEAFNEAHQAQPTITRTETPTTTAPHNNGVGGALAHQVKKKMFSDA